MYHVTTNLTDAQRDLFTEAAASQEERVLAFFQANPAKAFSPSDVWKALFSTNVPLTSVRRCVTNLANEGKLVKINNATKPGPYARPEHLWRVK